MTTVTGEAIETETTKMTTVTGEAIETETTTMTTATGEAIETETTTMTTATGEAIETEVTSMTDSGLVQALVDQRRDRLTVELGGGVAPGLITFTAVDDVLDELLDDESVDRWRARAAATLARLGIPGPGTRSIAA